MPTSSPSFAVTITGPQRAELLPVDPPALPLAPKEVTGKTRISLISAGTELAGCFLGQSFPSFPGYAAIFKVEAIGENVQRLQPGDLALCMGPHRSFQRIHESQALKLPDGLKPEEAVFARMMSVSMSTLVTTTARPPDRVLVMGLGLVGHLASQIFTRCGYEVCACDPSEKRRNLAKDRGIRRIEEKAPLDDPDWEGRVSLALECSGHEAAALDACKCVRKRGEVALIGTPWIRRTEMFAHDLLHAIFHRYVVVRSGWEWEVPMDPMEFRAGSILENQAAALRWLREGSIRVDGLYEKVSPEAAQHAYERLQHQQNERLAVLFDWDVLRGTEEL
jgi:threonine dehydrogenase-like Zn-dependent dehydrogenase